MRVVEVLDRSGGVVDARTLVRFTSRRKVRTAVRQGQIVRLVRGRYALPTADQALAAAHGLAGVVTHGSAAAYWGWESKHPPALPVVSVPRNRKVSEARQDGVDVKWRDLPSEDVTRDRVTTPGRTVMDCAKDLPFDEALAIADSALRHRDVTKEQLLRLAGRVPTSGRAACMRVANEASGLAANPFESVLRAIALDVPGLELVPQVVISESGFTGRPDLVDEARRIVLEAESFEFHGSRKAMKRDCERYNALATRGWVVLRFSWEHVMYEPRYVADCLAAVVAFRRPQRRATVPKTDRRTA